MQEAHPELKCMQSAEFLGLRQQGSREYPPDIWIGVCDLRCEVLDVC